MCFASGEGGGRQGKQQQTAKDDLWRGDSVTFRAADGQDFFFYIYTRRLEVFFGEEK